jgi:cold shock CspA family protein
MATRQRRRGVVTTFDEAAGMGVVTDAEGSEVPFHCTAIADGTRTIPVGVDVTFDLVPGRSGAWEAARIDRV